MYVGLSVHQHGGWKQTAKYVVENVIPVCVHPVLLLYNMNVSRHRHSFQILLLNQR